MIHQRLREERKRLQLTQQGFAELARTTKGTIVNWEKGASSPTAVQLASLEEAGVDTAYVITDERSGHAWPAQPSRFKSSTFCHQLLRLKDQLGLQQDREIAALLGLSNKASYSRKIRNSFPVDKLKALSFDRPALRLDVEYILTGHSRTTPCPGGPPMNAPNTTNPSFTKFYAQHLTVNGDVIWAMPAEPNVPVSELTHMVDNALRHHNGRVFVAVALLPPDEHADEALPAPDPDDSTGTNGESA